MASLAERLASPTTTTVFERMSALARDHGAINLGQGFPDMPDPPELIAAAQRALAERSNQYPPMRGLPELRRAVAGYYRREQELAVSEDMVVVTSGATEALAAALFALVGPGDEVILVQPCYDAYAPLVARAGGTVRFVSLTPPHWTLDPAALAAAVG
ncbi:MAG: aminotransferase class I/II-fold pyridoxal phosphate-dependent enzyme, partial [Sphingomonadales bacterium]|nr:aminotransferase class I/II-fold pyridoxal phosphate-dependent enzyme [Sphingomonadales bacterium]